jgi:hypothetical protein
MPAHAPAATVAVTEGRLVVTTTAPGRNVIDVNPDGVAYRIFDSIDPVSAGEGCLPVSLNEVVCGGSVAGIVVTGGGGDDLLGLWRVKVPVIATGGDGRDLIETGSGTDEIMAGPGADAVVAAAGDDTVSGGDGADRLAGGDDGDDIAGGADADVIVGGAGDDGDLSGGDGDDLVDGGSGEDGLDGNAGDDSLVATRGDHVVAVSGNDRVYGSAAAPRVSCGTRCRRFSRRRSAPRAWASASFAAFVRQPGRAQYVSVDVAANVRRRARVCIVLYDRDNVRIQRFPARVQIPLGTIKRPRPTPEAVFAEGTLKKRGCARKRF